MLIEVIGTEHRKSLRKYWKWFPCPGQPGEKHQCFEAFQQENHFRHQQASVTLESAENNRLADAAFAALRPRNLAGRRHLRAVIIGWNQDSDILISHQTLSFKWEPRHTGLFLPSLTLKKKKNPPKPRCSFDNRKKKKDVPCYFATIWEMKMWPELAVGLAYLQREMPDIADPTGPVLTFITLEKYPQTYLPLFSLQIPIFELPRKHAFIFNFAPPELSRGVAVSTVGWIVPPQSQDSHFKFILTPSTSECDLIWT